MSRCPVNFQYIYLVSCFLLVLLGINLKAPFFTQDKPRAAARSKQLKVRALILAIIAFLTAVMLLIVLKVQWSMGIATGLLFQGIMLLPPGVKGTLLLDNFINGILFKGGETK